jgi:hypothetical protein
MLKVIARNREKESGKGSELERISVNGREVHLNEQSRKGHRDGDGEHQPPVK